MDPEQMEWLKKDLAATTKRCILFSHQSIDRAMNNGYDVRDILEAENKRAGFTKVVAAFSSNEDFVFVEQRIERVAKLLSGLRKVLRRRMEVG